MWLFLLFIMSAIAWMKGDDSMKWVVIIGVVLLICAYLFSGA